MQARESADPARSESRPARLFKKQLPENAPVTKRSTALFRFGEQCNNHCPMCSNTGDPALFFHSTDELLRRADFLSGLGFRRVVVTGGEATIHPGFWQIIDRLVAHRMAWDANTHGRTFARPFFAQRAVETGLKRAIVSLHSLEPRTSAAIFGASEEAHHETVAGIERLLEVGVDVMLNCVLTRLNLPELEEYLRGGHRRFGRGLTFKFVFPSTIGKGGRWAEIDGLRYDEVHDTVRGLRAIADASQLRVSFEAFPNCVLEDPEGRSLGRSAFGETHYLDDAGGDRVYAMRHIETELSAFAEACRSCVALPRCCGVSRAYAERHGVAELRPFPALETTPEETR